MAMTSLKRRKAMNREQHEDDLVEIAVASEATRGAAMGYEDHDGTLWLRAGLADD
jgi:hypothetical protein